MGLRGDFWRLGLLVRVVGLAVASLALAQCSSRFNSHLGVSASPRVVGSNEPVPKGGGVYRVGQPYVVAGRLYVPKANPHYSKVGMASWYGDDFRGRLTANGEVFDNAAISAASPVLPMPCYARVTNLRNGRSIIVRVNDRGPYAANRLIDVSEHTAKLLGFYQRGLTRVRVTYVGPAPLAGSSDQMLMATLREDEPAPAPGRIRLASNQTFASPEQRDEREFEAAPVSRQRQFAARASQPSERRDLTPEARIEQTFGSAPAPALASINAASVARSGASAQASPDLTAYASSGASAAFMSGRGIY